MTEHEIASAIQNYVTSHEGVTNFNISVRQIRDEVDSLRIRTLAELETQGRSMYPLEDYMQDMEVNTIREGTRIVAQIPLVYIDVGGRPAFSYLGGVSLDTNHKVVTGRSRSWAHEDPWTGKMKTVWYNSGRLEFLHKNVPEKVMITAVFRKPSDLFLYGYDWKKDEYPVPYSVTDILIGKTSESYLRTMYRIFPQSNTQSDIPVSPQPVK